MLVTLKDVLAVAEKNDSAIGAFNTPNLESIMAVIKAAEELDEAVIIMHAHVHEDLMPLSVIGPIMVDMAKKSSVPVCVHLDHGQDLDYLKLALEIGFTSVMYDGSALPYEENAKNTCLAVKMAKKYEASVEAEIGTLGKRETGAVDDGDDTDHEIQVYTNPDMAKRFVEETGIDALACSFGTAHGLYLKKPKLDMSVLEDVREKIALPIVMHGGSGVSDSEFKRTIKRGVRKVNYYTYMAKKGGQIVSANMDKEKDNIIYFHDIVAWGVESMKEDVKSAIKVFSNKVREERYSV